MNKCILCQSSRKDDIRYGKFLNERSIGVHTFCLYLSSNLAQNGEEDEGIIGFLEEDIKKEVNRIASVICVFCKRKYANIGCCNQKCHRSYHLICGLEHDCQYIFSHDFSSYCRHHAIIPKERPNPDETCLICYESLCTNNKFKALRVILPPCCRSGWFHNFCLQKFALSAGYFFKCPLCNNVEIFREKLPHSGIFIPNQDAAWELEPNAFAELHERPSECCAQKCKNGKGRKDHSNDNPFIMCITCGSAAIHKKCFNKKTKNFYCADCTVAFEEGDSGRESLNSHVTSANNEDEYVDVCQISDKEDLQAIIKLMDTSNKTAEKRKDPSGHSLRSDEEMPDTTKKHSRIGSIDDLQGSDEEMPHTTKKHSKIGRIDDLQGSDEEMPHTTKKPSRIGRIDELQGSAEEMPHTTKQHNRIMLIENLDGSDEEMPHTSKKYNRFRRIMDTSGEDSKGENPVKQCLTRNINRNKRIKESSGKGSKDENAKKECCNNLRLKGCGFSRILRSEGSKLSIRSETETSEGVLNDRANKPNCTMINSRQITNDFEHGVVNDFKVAGRIKETSPDVFNTSDMKNLKISQSVLQNQQIGTISIQSNLTNSEGQSITKKERRIQEKLSNSDATSASTIASESDDVFLQNFLQFRENQKTNIVPSKPIRSNCNENNDVHLCTNNFNQKEIMVPEKRNTGSTYFNLDTSCIAKRTRRKSLSCNISSSIKNECQKQNDVLNASCIALRTRPRRACSQTKSFCRDISYVFENIRKSKAAFEFVIDASD